MPGPADRPEVVRTIAELRARVRGWHTAGETVGMVPTMGALHAGHLALVEAALAGNDRVVVTLFVNPTQFAANEDLGSYPRTEATDRIKLARLAPDLLFVPNAAEMYPRGFDTAVTVGGPSAGLETDFRPTFFRGVATVVAKLLLAGQPDRAYFGEKDFQQLLVVRQLVGDLSIPTEIVGRPTLREPDGLAMSSRNAYLSAEDRARAPKLHEVLEQVASAIHSGEAPDRALERGRTDLEDAAFKVDYLELRNALTLAPPTDQGNEPLRLLVGARLGKTRLIDNIPV